MIIQTKNRDIPTNQDLNSVERHLLQYVIWLENHGAFEIWSLTRIKNPRFLLAETSNSGPIRDRTALAVMSQ